VNLNQGLVDLVAVALVAALAPLIVAVLPGPRVPQVVILLVGGVLIGPHVLGVAETSNIQLLANIGLGFLFLLAGYELDPQLLRQRPGRLAMVGWLISAVVAVGVTAGLGAFGFIRDYVPIGLALTTTALGTLLPILRDNDMLGGQFGQYVYAALRDLHPDLLRLLRHDPRLESDRPEPAAPARLFPAAADRPRAALVAGLPACSPGPAAGGDDFYHCDHVAAADCPGRDRPARWGHAPRQCRCPGRRGRAVGSGVPLIAVGLYRSAPLTPADVGITAAETAARADAPPATPSQPAPPEP
jgi:hypothetical protein